MFSIFKKQTTQISEPTFKMRVERFWDWYEQVASRFYETIEQRNCERLQPEVSEKVDELGPGFAWVFGPGKEKGHSFTLSGEGVLHRQLLAQYWLSRAPNLLGWTFHSERQPGPTDGIKIEIDNKKFNPIEFWITPIIDEESQKIDITAWHPLFNRLTQEEQFRVLFLFLDEVLGEFGTGQWIGEINLNDKKLPDAFPLKELSGFIANLERVKGWKKFPPGKGVAGYRCDSPHLNFLRGDTIAGTTVHFELVNQYLRAEGKLQDPLAGTGADYVFICFNAGILPKGKQVEVRAKIEDALDEALRVERRGRLLGGALGTQFAYIDLLIYDGAASLETVKRTLKERALPIGTTINFFAAEKCDQSVVL